MLLPRLSRNAGLPVYDALMTKSFEELDYQKTPLGELVLRRRKIPMLDNEIVYEVILNDEFLMSSLFHAAEDALADLGLSACPEGPVDVDVVVGGLGLGYTAAAALKHPKVRSLRVIEYLAPVIRWHREGLLPLGTRLADDPRLQFVHADFFASALGTAGMDPDAPGQKFHAILLDIDHTPGHWLNPTHGALYSTEGLTALSRSLHNDGVFAMWSDGPSDPDFLAVIGSVFRTAEAKAVRFENPIQGGESESTVYVAAGLRASPDRGREQ